MSQENHLKRMLLQLPLQLLLNKDLNPQKQLMLLKEIVLMLRILSMRREESDQEELL